MSNLKFALNPSTGHERTVQVNYLSTVPLAILLLLILKAKTAKDEPGRLTISNAALTLHANFPNRHAKRLLPSFDDPKFFDPGEQYSSSKLLAHFFLWELVEYVSAHDVIMNLADPGFVKGTQLNRNVPGVAVMGLALFGAMAARNVADGASTYVDGAVGKGRRGESWVFSDGLAGSGVSCNPLCFGLFANVDY